MPVRPMIYEVSFECPGCQTALEIVGPNGTERVCPECDLEFELRNGEALFDEDEVSTSEQLAFECPRCETDLEVEVEEGDVICCEECDLEFEVTDGEALYDEDEAAIPASPVTCPHCRKVNVTFAEPGDRLECPHCEKTFVFHLGGGKRHAMGTCPYCREEVRPVVLTSGSMIARDELECPECNEQIVACMGQCGDFAQGGQVWNDLFCRTCLVASRDTLGSALLKHGPSVVRALFGS